MGETPTAYRAREHDAVAAMPSCEAKQRTKPVRKKPSSFGEATTAAAS
jgi:hypothetical protein